MPRIESRKHKYQVRTYLSGFAVSCYTKTLQYAYTPQFIGNTGKAMVATGLITLAQNGDPAMIENKFIHHVYFWLKNIDNKEDRAKLVEGLKKLSKVKTLKTFHIGQPADTKRDVIDRSYAISWFVMFDNGADQQSYQIDPIHLKFVEDCSHLWSKVIVYDSVDVK